MPRYDYRCPKCGHTITLWHSSYSGEVVFVACDHCESKDPMVKLISAVPHKFMNPRGTMGVRLNGSDSKKENIDTWE